MEVRDIFYKFKNRTLEPGFRFHADGFQCEESAFGEVDFIWMTSSNTEFTFQMLTDLHVPRIRWSGYNIEQSGCLNYTDTRRDDVSGREVTRTYKVKFRAEFEYRADKNFHVVQFKRVPDKSETDKRWVFEYYNEGMMYLTGDGMPYDRQKAIELFEEAAEMDHPGAQKMLEELEYTSPEEYLSHIKPARNGDAWSQLQVGLAYYNGKGVDKDEGKAVDWFLKSAMQGNMYAQANIGNCYVQGIGVEKDEAKAVEWWLMAGAQGYGQSNNNLGDAYRDGKGVPQNKAKAIEYYNKAVDQGYEKAKDKLKELGKPYKEKPKPKESSSSDDYVEKRGVFTSLIFGGIGGSGLYSLAGFIVNQFNITGFSDIIFWASMAVGFILTFFAWRNRKTVLLIIMIAIAALGYAGNFLVNSGIIPKSSGTAAEQAATATINRDGINFRPAPSTDNTAIRQLNKGDTVILTGEMSGAWTQVTHKGDTGWVSSEFLEK